jgi:hypothetical protein
MRDREGERGQTIVIAAVGMGVMVLVLFLVVNLGGVLLTLANVNNTLRDAGRAGTLAGDGQSGGLHLDQIAAADAAQTVFDVGIAQVSNWLASVPVLDVEVLNPPDGGCAVLGATCYRRPTVRLRTSITVNVLLGEWLPVSFDLETVVVSGVGHPATVSTPVPTGTPAPIPTVIIP